MVPLEIATNILHNRLDTIHISILFQLIPLFLVLIHSCFILSFIEFPF